MEKKKAKLEKKRKEILEKTKTKKRGNVGKKMKK